MQRSLARSILRPIARASTSTTRPGPSIRKFTSISSGSRCYHAHRQGDRFCSPTPIQNWVSQRCIGIDGKTSHAYRALSVSSTSRYADDVKDKIHSASIQAEGKDDVKETDSLGETVSSASNNTSESTFDQAARPESPSSSDSTASTAPPQSSDSIKTSSNNIHSHASALLERIRANTASLPSFDGLTSSTSLSNALASITTHTRTLLSHLRTRLSDLSTQYNTHTGYSAIEDLKSRISELEASLDSARTLATTAKRTYLLAVQNRSASQRETNDLLSRKSSWDETDLSRYTELLRKEHALSKQETEAEKVLERSEAEVQASFDELMKAVMVRYHEEQVWSDRMRGMSTYGSLVVAGLNAFLFILAILLVEPYKRKKLAETFESRLVAAEHESRQLILASVDQFQHSLNAALAPSTSSPAAEAAQEPLDASTPPSLHEETETPFVEPAPPAPAVAVEAAHRNREEERLVFASTLGVVVGAALSLVISACWT